jgi:hypothetical protein
MPTEELLTRWTIRLALACYVTALAIGLATRGRSPRGQLVARILWTAGCLLFLGHVACAFGFYHDWSHARALADTARQTKELIGWEFGEGIYFSYLFTLLWVADVIWWWLAPASYVGRVPPLRYAIHGFMAFIAFNGAIVFEGGPTRWFGIAACVILGGLFVMRMVSSFNRKPTATAKRGDDTPLPLAPG